MSFRNRLRKDFMKYKYVYLMLLPVVAYFIIFAYVPIAGNYLAFSEFSAKTGLFGGRWVGFKYFIEFFKDMYFFRVIRNTFILNIYDIICFPAPILLAVMLNEIRHRWFRTTIQSISYMPYFVSTVALGGIILLFSARDGVFNSITALFGMPPTALLKEQAFYRPIYILSNRWTFDGWSSIIYLAAISSVDTQLYEAAAIDGCGRIRRIFHVTIPGISSTVIILFILRLGNIMTVGFEKTMLIYNNLIYDVSDVLSTYAYRRGLLSGDFSFATAVGLFNSVLNFTILILANKIIKRLSGKSLW